MKSKFLKSTIILLLGGFLTKILGMLIRILMSRELKSTGMGLYMLVMPTFSLFISLAQLGLPVAISKLVAEDRYNNKNLVFSVIPITLLFNVLLFLVIFFLSPFLSTYFLHDERCNLALFSIGFVLPFISISSILRGYFFGKERMFPHVLSNVIEDLVRFLLLLKGIPFFMNYGIEYAVAFTILVNLASELTSILVLFFFLPKNFHLKKEDFKPQKKVIKNVFSITIPTTGSRIIGSIGYFLEPIILTNVLLKCGYSNDFIVTEYGILNGYVMPLLLLPSFFTLAISQALLPIVSKHHSKGNYTYAKRKIKEGMLISLLIGIPMTLIFIFYPEFPLSIIYHTTEGGSYMKILAPLCLFHYVQAILSSSLQAMGKAKVSMRGTLYAAILRTICLFLFSFLFPGLYGLILATGVNIVFVTLYDGLYTFHFLKEKNRVSPIDPLWMML